VAEHHKFAQPALVLHGLKGQKRSECLAGSWPGVHQHVPSMAAGRIKPAAQQLNQLLLPDPWPDALLLRLGTEGKGGGGDGPGQEDESF